MKGNDNSKNGQVSDKKTKILSTAEILELLTKLVDALNQRVGHLCGEKNIESIDELDETMDFKQKVQYLNQVLDSIEGKLKVIEEELDLLKEPAQRVSSSGEKAQKIEQLKEELPEQNQVKLEKTEVKSKNIEQKLNSSSKENEEKKAELIDESDEKNSVVSEENNSLTKEFVRQLFKSWMVQHGQDMSSVPLEKPLEIVVDKEKDIKITGVVERDYHLNIEYVRNGEKQFQGVVDLDRNRGDGLEILKDELKTRTKESVIEGAKEQIKEAEKEREVNKKQSSKSEQLEPV